MPKKFFSNFDKTIFILFLVLTFTGCKDTVTTEVSSVTSSDESDIAASAEASPIITSAESNLTTPTESTCSYITNTHVLDYDGNEVDQYIDLSEYEIIENQSFDVKLNDWGNVRFVSMSRSTTFNPLYMLYKDGQPIYQFPIFTKENQGAFFYDVYLVAFKDVDEDGKDEVITGYRYLSGAGPTGCVPRCDISIYKDYGTHFEYMDELCGFILENVSDFNITLDDVCDTIPKYNLSIMEASTLYKNIKPVTDAEVFEGTWTTTNCHSSQTGVFTISDQTKNGFSFEGTLRYYSAEDSISGNAHFVSKYIAICNNADSNKPMGEGYIIFYLYNNRLYVKPDYYWNYIKKTYDNPDDYYDDAKPNYEYTKEAPKYTNLEIIDETFDQKELKKIKEVIGADFYENKFMPYTKNGYVHSTSADKMEDGTICKHVECLSKTTGELYDLLLAPGKRVYIVLHSENNKSFFTNDPNWTNKTLPITDWDPYLERDDFYNFE